MALDNAALLEVLEAMQAAGVEDRVRTAAQTIYQALIDAELTAVIGAGPWERTEERTAQRNGSRPRMLTTTAGDLELRIPKLRTGSFFPSLLERRRRVDQALFAVVMEAYLHGVSTRKVDDLVKALGADTGISKSEVSRICADLDEEVGAFRDRSLAEIAYPYVFLDATYCKARVNRRVVSQAVVIATGVTADGRREVLGLRRRRHRGRGVLDRVPARSEGPRPGRGAAGHLRRPHRPEGRDRLGADRRRLAAVPGPLHAQRARGGPEGQRRDGRRRDPHHLRPTRRRARPRAVRGDRHDARPAAAQGRADAPRGPRRPARLHRLPGQRTGRRSGRPTRSSGSTRRSNAAPTSSASSPTPPPCSAWPARSWSRPTTNGKSPPTAATSPKPPWNSSPTQRRPTRRWPSPNS